MSGQVHGGLKPAATQTGGAQSAIDRALFRGEHLHMGDADYRAGVATLMDPLLFSDAGGGDLTVEALGVAEGRASAQVLAKEPGVAAGLEEFAWLLSRRDIAVKTHKQDGEAIQRGDVLAEIEGQRGTLLSRERTMLNLLQRMSGIATMTREMQERVARVSAQTRVVATRKTPWGLLDKRAVHLGGGGTHRLSLSDAILIKNNHLALLGSREEDAVIVAIDRAWALRERAAFIEVEVRSAGAAVVAARAFRGLRASDSEACPCLLLLDNMSPEQVRGTLDVLHSEGLRDDIFRPGGKYSPDSVLVEVSGAINESNLDEYASCGADALSMGALTHSPRALDLSLRIS
jgi:nicotinate-nucleotide pyrophosphorylase (carboxylating)